MVYVVVVVVAVVAVVSVCMPKRDFQKAILESDIEHDFYNFGAFVYLPLEIQFKENYCDSWAFQGTIQPANP